MNFKPYDYQQYCIDRVVSDPAIGLMLDMGLGKTIITLLAINVLRFQQWTIRRVLVIAPKKVAEATWSVEAQKWEQTQHLRVRVVMGTAKQRINELHMPADIWVINRDNVSWLVNYYRENWPFDMVILDESSSFKNHQSKRWRSLKLIRDKIKRIVLLTGTPAPNGLEDLWAQLFLLDGGQRLGRTLTSFRDMWFRPDKRSRTQIFSYSPRENAESAIKEAVGDICVSMSAKDYLTLPDYVDSDVPVHLDDAAKKKYIELERQMILEIDEQTVTALTAAALNSKLLQLCSGNVYDIAGTVAPIHTCKIEAFLELIEQLHGQPVLVAYWYKHERAGLVAVLKSTGLRVRVYENADDAAAWNAGEIDVLLAHPASCAYGLNLQHGGNNIVWYTLPNWNLELYQQFNCRLYRQGQDKPVVVHHLVVQGGMDEDVLAALRSKGDQQAALLEAIKARIERYRA